MAFETYNSNLFCASNDESLSYTQHNAALQCLFNLGSLRM